MSSNNDNSNNELENLCVVCCKQVEIYSVGECDHPVCFECSTRMRVLCNQNECPICRGQMPKVIFTRNIEPFNSLFSKYQRSNYQDPKYGLVFCAQDIKKAYQELLEYRCTICTKEVEQQQQQQHQPQQKMRYIFYTFQQLKDHMRKEHNLFYCDLCIDNLKIFTFERRCYTKQELSLHRRKGDIDNTSHRGHPLCEFCEKRFMDSDELFRHLRRIHLFCHYCDADGKHQYYNRMEDLKKHFRDEHYLCEEGECRNEILTAVFKTEIDLKAHIATEHSKHMSKLATKQARTLELEFTLAPRPRPDRYRRPQSSRIEDEGAVGYDTEGIPGGGGGGGMGSNSGSSSNREPTTLTALDFPALGNSSTVAIQNRPITTVNYSQPRSSQFTVDDFPSLGGSSSSRGSSAVTITTNSTSSVLKKKPDVTITRTVRNNNQQKLARNSENFPSLGPSVRVSVNSSNQNIAPKVSIHVNHNTGITSTHISSNNNLNNNDFNVNQRPTEAFPALGNSTVPIQPTQWVSTTTKKKPEPKVSKVAPAPQLPPSDLSQFPSLNNKQDSKKKSSSVTVPVNNNNNNNNSNMWGNISVNSKSNKSTSKTITGNKATTSGNNNNTVNNNYNNNNSCNNNNKDDNSGKNNKGKNKKQTTTTTNSNKTSALPNSTGDGNNISSDTRIEEGKNGIVKKRSELKIGTLYVQDNNSSGGGGSGENVKPPPGFPARPPPGLESFPALSNNNDLTFTNSSGQSYAISPKIYHQPPNFHIRNQNLIKNCNLDNELITEFKSYSKLFKSGDMPVNRYYEYCKAMLGDNFDKVFPELLVLLPDVNKQQELYNVYDGVAKKNLLVCENCKQVIFKNELKEHYNSHSLDSQFPSLGLSRQQTDISNAWRK